MPSWKKEAIMRDSSESGKKQPVKFELSMKIPPSRLLLHFVWGYTAVCIALMFRNPLWFNIGTFIGMIIVLTVCQYFFENILVPYDKELRSGVIVDTGRHSVNIWMLEWILPAGFLHLIIVCGFMITIEGSPFENTAYTHPYKYGEMYVQYTQINKIFDEKLQNTARNKSVSEHAGEVDNKKQFLMAEFQAFLNDKERAAINDGKHSIEMSINKLPFLIALTFGFLGTLLYTLNDHVFRYYTGDLYPKTLVSYIVRFIFAPSLCLVVAYFSMNNWWVNAAPAIFLFIGFFPQRAMMYLEEKAMETLKIKQDNKEEISLGKVEGITEYYAYRFKELGVGDVQNLAWIDLNYLLKNLGSSDSMLADFVAQAMLIIFLKNDIEKLRSYGLRDIIVFNDIIASRPIEDTAKDIGIEPEKLRIVYNYIENNPVFKDRIDQLRSVHRNMNCVNEFILKARKQPSYA